MGWVFGPKIPGTSWRRESAPTVPRPDQRHADDIPQGNIGVPVVFRAETPNFHRLAQTKVFSRSTSI